ncbi:MAG TPA: GAF domain-containing protein [Dehalococcoidia bacterium]|nr:GAF domain-containing protein [Dehalococcoidia bacterium]
MTATQEHVRLRDIPTCFEGIIPSTIATVDSDGTPNVTYLSIVHRIDDDHVALSRQFFKKTDHNTIVNPLAQVGLIEPETGRMFLLDLEYTHTESDGPLFERMRTHLDAVAAQHGMSNVFKLKGVDVCRVLGCTMAPCDFPEPVPPRTPDLETAEAFSRAVAQADDLDELLQATLQACQDLMGFTHAFVMLLDESGERLYTVASAGYSTSGAGSEVALGEGIIGLAAARRQSVRVTNMARELAYSRAVQASSSDEGSGLDSIPLPGLPSVQSQLVTPMLAHRELVGVLVLQSERPGAFQATDEWLMGILASQVALAMEALVGLEPSSNAAASEGEPRPVQVKYYPDDESIFLDNEYLIRGIAGGILWRLLREYQEKRRVEFSNREIRLDQTLALPDLKDNLEARLILLRKRLDERCGSVVRIEKTGRGRFRLVVSQPLALVTADGSGVDR